MSEVEVSPSTVTALKVSATPALSSPCRAAALSGASVNTNDSMVAMSGAIMPAPLAIPLMTTVADPSFAVAVATFGKRVGRHDRLGGIDPDVRLRAAHEPPITLANFVAGKGSPMTPVDASRTSLVLHLAASAASLAVKAVAARPVRPVKALALLELTTRARAFRTSFSRHQSTGADGHFDRVIRRRWSCPARARPVQRRCGSDI